MLYDKNSESDYFFSSTKIRIFFSATKKYHTVCYKIQEHKTFCKNTYKIILLGLKYVMRYYTIRECISLIEHIFVMTFERSKPFTKSLLHNLYHHQIYDRYNQNQEDNLSTNSYLSSTCLHETKIILFNWWNLVMLTCPNIQVIMNILNNLHGLSSVPLYEQ